MDFRRRSLIFAIFFLLVFEGSFCQSNNGTNTNATQTSGGQHYIQQLLQNALQNAALPQVVQQIQNALHIRNLSLPLSIMNPGNLQKLMGMLSSGAQSPNGFNLQDIAKLVGSSGDFSQLLGGGQDLVDALMDLSQNVSQECFGHIQLLASEVFKMTPWALRMIDAAGKIDSNLLNGNAHWTGSYDECLAIEAQPENMPRLSGKYCSASLNLASLLVPVLGPAAYAITPQMGVCMPNTCTESEIKLFFQTLIGMLPLGAQTPGVSDMKCSELPEYDGLAIAGFTVCGVFVVLMALSTLFDILYQRHLKKVKETVPVDLTVDPVNKYHVNDEQVVTAPKPRELGFCGKIAMSFSVYTNGKKILSTEQAGGALGAVNGIRFLSISWVVLGHAFAFAVSNLANPNFYGEFFSNWTSMVIINGLLSVDSFFTLSGLLLSYLFMKEMKREKGRINWFMFYFHRFWRLTPPYLLVMFLDIALFRYVGDGPFWQKDGVERNFCKDTFWTNIIYVNNLVKPKEMCFGWSWYLANDMQFYVISPILLVPLFFWKKIGLFINFLALLAIFIATGRTYTHFDLLPTLMTVDYGAMMAQFEHYFYDYYVVPWCRMGPYIVGIITGYCLYETKGVYKIPKAVNVFIWITMAILAVLVVYGIYDPANGRFWGQGLSSLYGVTHRTVWGMCVCWVVFACVTGNGGFVNDLLSWKPFIPLGRLSYGIYLVHPLVIYGYLQSLRSPVFGSNTNFTYIFLASHVLSIMMAFVASLAFEAPMMALEKAIFKRGKRA